MFYSGVSMQDFCTFDHDLHNSFNQYLTLHRIYVLLLHSYTMIVYVCYMYTLKCGGVLAFILLTVYIHTHNYLYIAYTTTFIVQYIYLLYRYVLH